MSRIGKNPITVPQGVTLTIGDNNLVTVKGPKGEIVKSLNKDMHIKMEENVLTIERPSESKEHKSFHGLTRALLNNMIIGVNEGFKKNWS